MLPDFCPREALHVALSVLARHGLRQPFQQLPPFISSPLQTSTPSLPALLRLLDSAASFSGQQSLFLEFGLLLGMQHGRSQPQRLSDASLLTALQLTPRVKHSSSCVRIEFNQRTHVSAGLWEMLLAYTHARLPLTHIGQIDAMHIELPFPKPEHANRYPYYVPISMRFNADFAGIMCSQRQWQHLLNWQQIHESNSTSQERVILEKACNLLYANLTSPPSQQHIAEQLLQSERTFKRRLQSCGQSYQSILVELKLRQACLWLQHGPDNISDVANRLGYANVANFSKAFKKWAGCAPSHWGKKATACDESEWPPLEQSITPSTFSFI